MVKSTLVEHCEATVFHISSRLDTITAPPPHTLTCSLPSSPCPYPLPPRPILLRLPLSPPPIPLHPYVSPVPLCFTFPIPPFLYGYYYANSYPPPFPSPLPPRCVCMCPFFSRVFFHVLFCGVVWSAEQVQFYEGGAEAAPLRRLPPETRPHRVLEGPPYPHPRPHRIRDHGGQVDHAASATVTATHQNLPAKNKPKVKVLLRP